MSGAGRRHRAKKLTGEFLDDGWDAVLREGEEFAVVRSTPGGKQITAEFSNGAVGTLMIPGRFHKVIWLLRGDPIVVEGRSTVVRKLSTAQLEQLSSNDEYANRYRASKESVEIEKCDEEDEELVNPNRHRYGSRKRLELLDEDEEDEEEEEEEEADEAETADGEDGLSTQPPGP